MSDKALKNAERLRDELLERKAELRGELDAIEARLAKTETFIADWHTFADSQPDDSANPVPGTEPVADAGPRPRPKRLRTNSRKEEVAETALDIIRERGEPVSRADLYETLVARGLRIEGADPEMVLTTMLWRMKHRIVRLKSGNYWPAETPEPSDPDLAPRISEQPAPEPS